MVDSTVWCVYWLTGYRDRHPGCEPYNCSDVEKCRHATRALERMPTMKRSELPEYLVHESAIHRRTAFARSRYLDMLRYPDIYRIPVKGHQRRGKKYLTINDVKVLLDGVVEVEEKLDGKWLRVPTEGYILFKEDCKRVHTVRYNALPAWEICFDIWDGEKFLGREEKLEVLKLLNIPPSPLLYWGKMGSLKPLVDLIGSPSAFGAERVEGIVIKNPEKQLFGKIVDPLFDREVDESEHHIRRPYEMNRLDVSKMYLEV